MDSNVDRRSFLWAVGIGATAGSTPRLPAASAGGEESGPYSPQARQAMARQVRYDAADGAFRRGMPRQIGNRDEITLPGFIGNHSKGLPHNVLGEVDPGAYLSLLDALRTGQVHAFDSVPRGGTVKFTNPLAGLAFAFEGADTQSCAMPAAPSFRSAEGAADLAELYWMSLLRDVDFVDYATDVTVARACTDLSNLAGFRGPKQGGQVTPATLFRGLSAGDVKGPLLSQFLLQSAPQGSLILAQRQRTAVSLLDYMTDVGSWLNIQNGGAAGVDQYDATPRFIRNLRDLATYVHFDPLYLPYVNASLILMGLQLPPGPGNPYKSSQSQQGFGTFGPPHLQALLAQAASRALRTVWYQKWFVQRRLRPEEFAGRVHMHMTSRATYPIHQDLLNSDAVQTVFARYGTYLLPQAFPEGCPTHPSYGAGHATVAGACATILKAWFDEQQLVPNPVVPAFQGVYLAPYTGADAGFLTVGGEINKLAANIAIGRNGAGIHYRSDYSESLRLGERVAIMLLQESKSCYAESHYYTFTTFDGVKVTI